jgi:hypothetical protein
MRFFNTAGPVNCAKHYCLSPIERFNLSDILSLIDQEKYFVLHAPRQTGKTSCLLALMKYLNERDQYYCLYANVEMAQAARENIEQGMNDILREMAQWARFKLNDDFLQSSLSRFLSEGGYGTALNTALSEWCNRLDRPLVLLLDEVDSLIGDTLISLLRQIRAGYTKRPSQFPQSIILCGVRDIRDYRIHSSSEKSIITGGSAFNIKAKSLRLGDFSESEVKILLQQHTQETGQIFEPEATNMIWNLTMGQPWLVNALAYEVCFEIRNGRDRTKPVTSEMVITAKENLIYRRETHLDQLADKLKEDRVRRVIKPILQGIDRPSDLLDDDIAYVRDLGLIRTDGGQVVLSNPIYREVIPRELTFSTQYTISHQPAWYIAPDGRLDMDKLLSAFQEFFREHSEHWIERFEYKEAGPQLLLQAFLQRIVNSGGRIDREYGLGRGRTDLLIHWPHPSGMQKIVMELKILHKSLEKTIADGITQTVEYMDRCGTNDGHLIVFDREEKRTWEEKIFRRSETYQGRIIHIWGM